MKLPIDAIISEEKLTRYLLIQRDFDDKSQFLALAGYTIENYKILLEDIKKLVQDSDCIEGRTDEYGTFYRVEGVLPGVGKKSIRVITIWMKRKLDNNFYFITLIPGRRK